MSFSEGKEEIHIILFMPVRRAVREKRLYFFVWGGEKNLNNLLNLLTVKDLFLKKKDSTNQIQKLKKGIECDKILDPFLTH